MVNLFAQIVPMSNSVRKVNSFLMLKLPMAYLAGVRLKKLDAMGSEVSVKFRWINQNPFKSMYFAVQSMAAELTTGALLMKKIWECDRPVSMLVTNYKGSFHKKAVGRIKFVCRDALKIDEALKETIETGEGQVITMNSEGINEDGVVVSKYQFEWSIRLKSKN